MSKTYTHPDGAPDILGKTMTYYQFIDLLSDAWLEAETAEGKLVDPTLRRAIFYGLDKKVEKASQ